MQIFLMRHGTRNFTLGDVPLNAEGEEQARSIAELSQFRGLKTVLSSPKQRAQMTIAPLCESLQTPAETLIALDQRERGESEVEFIKRVQGVIDSIESGRWPSPLLLCSHSDWLSTALGLIPCDSPDIKFHMFHCAQYLEFSLEDKIWLLKSES